MTLQRRERNLLYVVGGLLAVLAGYMLLFSGDSRSTAELEADQINLQKDLLVKQTLDRQDKLDEMHIRQWRKRALPSDTITAQTLYQTWLRGLAHRCQFDSPSFESKKMAARADMYTQLSFTVRGHVSLANLTQFLYDFYSAGHLHQIRSMTMKSAPRSEKLDVTVSIEALSLPNADRKDQLCKEKGTALQLAKVENYRDPIVKRNLFAPYTPLTASAPLRKKPERPVDSAQFTIVTGFTEVDGVPQVWIQDRIAGKTWQLSEGGEFKVDQKNGKVRKIAANREVTLDFDGHRRRLRDGDNLRGGAEVEGFRKN